MFSTLKEGFLMAGGSAFAFLKENASREVEALLFVVAEGEKAAAEPRRREARVNAIIVLIVCNKEC
jgi:hypothetical protein